MTDIVNVPTPYYRIRVGKSDPKSNQISKSSLFEPELVELPNWVHDLIKGISITQNIKEGKGGTTATITFTQGSREIDYDELIGDKRTAANRPGTVLDLIYTQVDGKYKIEPVLQDDRDESEDERIKVTDLETELNALRTSLEITGTDKKTIEKTIKIKEEDLKKAIRRIKQLENPTYVFRELNSIEITYGWSSPVRKVYKVLLLIQEIVHSASKIGSSTTTIIAKDMGTEFSKFQTSESINFTTTKYKHDVNSGKIKTIAKVKSAKTPIKILIELTKTIDYALQVSPIYISFKFDSRNRKWGTGQSLYSFLSELAKECGAYFWIGYNWRVGKQCVYFLSKADMEKELYRIYWYGHPNSSLLDYTVSHSAEVGGDEQGNSTFNKTEKKNKPPEIIAKMNVFATKFGYDSSDMINVSKKTIIETGDDWIADQIVGNVIENPEYDPKKAETDKTYSVKQYKRNPNVRDLTYQSINKLRSLQYKVTQLGPLMYSITKQHPDKQTGVRRSAAASAKKRNAIKLRLTLLGDPYLCPSAIYIENIGHRYSGRYYIESVTHTFNIGGFYTSATACTDSVAKDGEHPDKPKNQTGKGSGKGPSKKETNVTLTSTEKLNFSSDIKAYVAMDEITSGEAKKLMEMGTTIINTSVGKDGRVHFPLGNIKPVIFEKNSN